MLALESVGLSLQVDFHRSQLDVIQQQRPQQSLLLQLLLQNLQAPSLDHSDNNRPNQHRANLDHPSNRLDIHASKLQHR
jgi:hypothetical protein